MKLWADWARTPNNFNWASKSLQIIIIRPLANKILRVGGLGYEPIPLVRKHTLDYLVEQESNQATENN